MLLYAALIACIVAVALLILAPAWGVLASFMAKPIIDATWDQPIVLGLKLTEVISGMVPLIVLLRIPFARDEAQSFRSMPLRGIWLVWTLYVGMFSAVIMYNEGLLNGTNVFFRHLNGIAGFYMVQAYFAKEPTRLKYFVWCLLLAGIFPVTTGLIEAMTGVHWRVTLGEGGVVRGIGFYHDAITIRYYALQTIMGLLLLSTLYIKRSTLVNLLALAYGIAAAVVLQRAYSKSGTLTLVSWAVLWPSLLKKVRALVVVGVASLVAAVWYREHIMESIGFIFHKEIAALQGNMGMERTFAGRWYTWEELIEQWQSFGTLAQLFGSGRVATGAHNDYIQVLFHGGIVGLLIYIALLLTMFERIVRNLVERIDVFAVAPLLAMVMWLVDTVGLVPSAYSGYQWFVWGVVGLCFRRREDELRQPKHLSPRVVPVRSGNGSEGATTLPRPQVPLILNLPSAGRENVEG